MSAYDAPRTQVHDESHLSRPARRPKSTSRGGPSVRRRQVMRRRVLGLATAVVLVILTMGEAIPARAVLFAAVLVAAAVWLAGVLARDRS